MITKFFLAYGTNYLRRKKCFRDHGAVRLPQDADSLRLELPQHHQHLGLTAVPLE
jgi:hypothetical protein